MIFHLAEKADDERKLGSGDEMKSDGITIGCFSQRGDRPRLSSWWRGWGGRLVFFGGSVAGVDDFAQALPVDDEGGDGFGRTSRHARGAWIGRLQLGDEVVQVRQLLDLVGDSGD